MAEQSGVEMSGVKWLGPRENPWEIEVLDCRPMALGMVSTTQDESTALRFLQLRRSSGSELIDALIEGARTIRCNLTYMHPGQITEGPLFKAAEMEDKWDIYFYNGHVLFARSWTGNLGFRATATLAAGFLKLSEIETGIQDEDPLVVRQVNFLMKSHVYGLQVPHPLPRNLGRDPQRLALHSFSYYGRKGLFGSFDEMSASGA
jgi:hypothetical protein